MAIKATHVSSGRDITIGPSIDADSQAVIDEIYQNCGAGVLECREHDLDPALADRRDRIDGRVHGAWVYLRKSPDKKRWQLVHLASGIGREFRTHEIPVGKSDQHQWQQDYYERAAQDAGYQTAQEVVLTTDTRLDLTITGPAGVFGVEIQHSHLEVPRVRARTRKARKAGITSIWSTDHKDPDWAFKVPHVETNALPDGNRPRGSWTVTTGPRRIIKARCEPTNFERCPTRRRNFCGGWHPAFRPIEGLVVDKIAEQVPAGDLVPLDTGGKQGIILVPASDAREWNESNYEIPPPRTELNPANRCSYKPTLPPPPATLIEPPLHRPKPCPQCNEPSWAIVDGRCLRCRTPAEQAVATHNRATGRTPAVSAHGATTVLGRLLTAGISEDRARMYLAAGMVRLDGQIVHDPSQLAPPPSRIVLTS